MYKSVFEHPKYGMMLHYENVDKARDWRKNRQGKNANKRKEMRSRKEKDKKLMELITMRTAESTGLVKMNKILNNSDKHIHPRHKRK